MIVCCVVEITCVLRLQICASVRLQSQQVWTTEDPSSQTSFNNGVTESSAPQGCSLATLSSSQPKETFYNSNAGGTAAGAADRDLICFPAGDACADPAHCTTLSPLPPPSPPPPSPPPPSPSPPPQSPPTPPPRSSSDMTSTPGFVGGMIGGSVALIGCCIFLAVMRKRKKDEKQDPQTATV